MILWFFQHHWVVSDPRVCRRERFARCYLSLSCHFHTLLAFTCADDSSLSLSCTRAAFPTLLNFAVQSFFWVRLPVSAFTPADDLPLLSDLAQRLVVSGHTSTQTCVH